jgi:hypothetical protein
MILEFLFPPSENLGSPDQDQTNSRFANAGEGRLNRTLPGESIVYSTPSFRVRVACNVGRRRGKSGPTTIIAFLFGDR